jgi:succinate dehydrogenase / fumarate reductase cytochrome b subunit
VPSSGPDARPGDPRSERAPRSSLRAAPRGVRRAFALTGVAPLGVFLVLHLAMNARALEGGTAFARAVRGLHDTPGVALFECLFVFAPLVFHGALGAWLIATRRTLGPSPYGPAVRAAMRWTAAGTLAFLAMHLFELRFRAAGARLDGPALATVLDADLSSLAHGVPWRGIAYLVGTGCAVFHLVCGAWGLARAWSGRRGVERITMWGAVAVGVALWLGFADVVVVRATGAKLFGGERADVTPTAPCIVPPPR